MNYLLFLLSILLVSPSVFACRGAMMEEAQEADALVLFEGKPIAYELGPFGPISGVTSGSLSKISFQVTKSIRGEQRKQWTAVMRGSTLPKSLSEFKTRFGDAIKVGLRDFTSKIDQAKLPRGYAGLMFIVDAACDMKGEDWLLRKVPQK